MRKSSYLCARFANERSLNGACGVHVDRLWIKKKRKKAVFFVESKSRRTFAARLGRIEREETIQIVFDHKSSLTEDSERLCGT